MSFTTTSAATGAGKIGAVKQAWDLAREVRNGVVARLAWTLSIDSDDELYGPTLVWLAELAGTVSTPRQLRVTTGHGSRSAKESPGPSATGRTPPAVRVVPGESGVTVLRVGGHRVWAGINRRELSGSSETTIRLAMETLTFRAATEAGRGAVLDAIREVAQREATRKPNLKLLNRWGGWDTRADLPERPLASVILPAEQKQFLIDDLARFLSSETEYVRRGVPYHRGYLLHGPPGTGKSSLVQAIAAHFSLDLWFAGLADARRDGDLIAQISQVAPRSVLLLEDIDVFATATSRQRAGEGPTMASLLNVLDGVATPHGLITFVTTNNKDALDPALIRAGRIDVDLELYAASWDLAEQLWRWFYAEPVDDFTAGAEGLPASAEVVEVFKRFPDDPAAGNKALLTTLGQAVGQ